MSMSVKVSVHKQPYKAPAEPTTKKAGTDEPASEWPSVKVGPTSVQVYGMGKWGAFLASPSGNDWQLFGE